MSIRNEEWNQIKALIRETTQKPEVKGFKRFLYSLREWGLVGVVITVFVSLLIAVITLAINLASGKSTEGEFRGTTKTRLENLEKGVDKINNTLMVIQNQITAGKYSNVSPPRLTDHRQELSALKSNLENIPKDTPGFWLASFQVIHLLSIATSYIDNPKATHSEMDNVEGVHLRKFGDVIVLKNRIANSEIDDSVIQFDPSAHLINVTFKNCVFIFPETATPPVNLQDIGGQILAASNISNVYIGAT